MRISDCSSDVCSSDLAEVLAARIILLVEQVHRIQLQRPVPVVQGGHHIDQRITGRSDDEGAAARRRRAIIAHATTHTHADVLGECYRLRPEQAGHIRSEEHTSELQSLMRISYAVFCLKKK